MTLRLSLLALSFMSATTLANPSGIIPIEDVTQGRLSAPPALPAESRSPMCEADVATPKTEPSRGWNRRSVLVDEPDLLSIDM